MSQLKPDESHVLLCDWQGRLNWSSKAALYEAYGELAWDYVVEHDRETYRRAFARATTLKTQQQIDVDCAMGGRYRAWLWPLHWPDTAVCILAMRIPDEMALLTPREHECLERLAYGLTVNKVAAKMDISTSTVHTLMRRARKKLKLGSIEELISFAARYCYSKIGPFKSPHVHAKADTA
jgi:DNA-binding CsgD family transcriptional regulator